MTIRKISPDDIETFTIVTNPFRTFSSSSQTGVTGSVNVFARRSTYEKEIKQLPAFLERTAQDANLESFLNDLSRKSAVSTNIEAGVQKYLSGVRAQGISARKQKSLDILRFTPSFTFTSNTLRKLLVTETLMPFYRSSSPSYNFAFSNYHSLNFFTASSVDSQAVLIYPNVPNDNNGFISGSYVPSGSFTFGFHINPRYTTDSPRGTFKAGTILHLSSTYAVSLVTGSSKDINGYADGFRLQLQLSHSADIRPSLATNSSFPNDLVFLSNDNSLKKNHWHEVVIRWGTSFRENGTGSFVIDGNEAGTFVVPSSSIAPRPFVGKSNPDVLCVGNFYEGPNTYPSSMQALFFATDPSERDGLAQMYAGQNIEMPASYSFAHPLNAEIHNVFVRDEYTTNEEIFSGSGKGLQTTSSYLFYVPPFFTHESPRRRFLNWFGGVLQTPFFSIDGTTQDPFNVALSFGAGGHYTNLENFTRDFATGRYPRQLFLTMSEITGSTTALSCNTFLYDNSSVRRRNLTILPCDDGTFFPNFDLIGQFSTASLRYHDDVGAFDRSLISLQEIVPSSSLVSAILADSGSMFDKVAGASPENLGLQSGSVYTIYQRTRDPSSNEVVFFDISNLFYGNKILPGTFEVTDGSVTGSNGRISITLKDDGLGNLFRADCFTSQSHWNSVGNVFYNEGLVVVKTPMIPFFGKDGFEISFQGEQNIHTMHVNVLARANTLNSSSNPSYRLISASNAIDLEEQEFVYLTGLQLHDDNLNVVTKTQFVQPIIKRTGDKLLCRIKIDF